MSRDRYIARSIINAKIASDSGKGNKKTLLTSRATNSITKKGYIFKDYFINCAIAAIIGSKHSKFRFLVEKGDIPNSYSIHFFTKNPKYGRLIMSFHTFDKGFKNLIKNFNLDRTKYNYIHASQYIKDYYNIY